MIFLKNNPISYSFLFKISTQANAVALLFFKIFFIFSLCSRFFYLHFNAVLWKKQQPKTGKNNAPLFHNKKLPRKIKAVIPLFSVYNTNLFLSFFLENKSRLVLRFFLKTTCALNSRTKIIFVLLFTSFFWTYHPDLLIFLKSFNSQRTGFKTSSVFTSFDWKILLFPPLTVRTIYP